MTYNYLLCEVTTGKVVGDVVPSAFSGQRLLVGAGSMSASIPLSGLSMQACSDLIGLTTPGKYSIVAERDGQPLGEWIIWKRSRTNTFSAISLFGNEMLSYLDHRLTKTVTYTQQDQTSVIAYELAMDGFRRAVAGVITIDTYTSLSGQLRDRTYLVAEATIGQRLSELGAVIGGFDYTVEISWTVRNGARYIRRIFVTSYPRAGQDRDMIFEMPGPDGSRGNMLAFQMDEDGAVLADEAFAIGGASVTNPRLIGTATQTTLAAQGFPMLQTVGSWTNVVTQATITDKALELVRNAASAVMPPVMLVYADGEPSIGDYSLGDRVNALLDPSPNFPTGYAGQVRILGWTISPPLAGPETVALTVTLDVATPGGEGLKGYYPSRGSQIRDLSRRLANLESSQYPRSP